MKKIKSVSEGPLLKKAIAQLTSHYTASSGEVKFRLAPEKAALVDSFRFMESAEVF